MYCLSEFSVFSEISEDPTCFESLLDPNQGLFTPHRLHQRDHGPCQAPNHKHTPASIGNPSGYSNFINSA
ncbi:MAG: hypothetical protein KA316_11865, partial [Rhodoferax sp.]|nr:hypothetical protein [Rhodoferax sp.]